MWILTSMLGFEKEQYGSLDGLDISTDGVAIPLFLNSLNIFTKSVLVLLSLLQLREYSKCPSLLNVPTWTPRTN